MRNQSRRVAWGAAVFLGYGDKADGLGIRPRVRWWMSQAVSLDLAPGLVQHIHAGGDGSGFAGQAAVHVGDWFAFTVQALKVRPPSPYSTQRGMAWYGGVRLGSYPGVIAAGIGLVVGLIFASAASGD